MSKVARVLVADDDTTNRLVLAKSLETAGYEVLTAADGVEAAACARRHRPDIVLLDVLMPGRSGLAVCSDLKRCEETTSIPVIFVTAASETDQILQGFAAGGCDYITRPFTVDEVLARVSVHVRLRQAEEELLSKNAELEGLARQLSETNEKLANSNRLDPLTNLLNRATWDEAIASEHERYERTGDHYSVIMIDLDHFKAFNDSLGHQAGDECLRRAAACMASTCRKIDCVGRYGGEEFVVLAPDTDAPPAIKLAERIRKAIWSLGIRHPSSETAGRVTASFGVATSDSGAWESVLRRADEALYVAKRGGRNMVFGDLKSLPRRSPRETANDADAHAEEADDPLADALTVLVVDDEPTNRVICRKCLQGAGYKVREAVDGVDAIASVRENPPDVILMDVMMPNMDGLECTNQLKSDPETCDIPVVIVSALGKGDDVVAGLKAGADEYLTKPIRTTELTLRVGTMARLHRERFDLLRSYEVRGEYVRVLARLVDFCRDVGTSRRVDDILNHTVAAVAEVAQARRISVMMPDSEKQLLTVTKSCGVDEELLATVRVPVGEPIAGRVFASGRSVVVNTEAEAEVAGGSRSYDSCFFASVPLLSAPLGTSGRVVGVLNVTERVDQQPFEPHEIEYIELIGKVAATACHDVYARDAHSKACDSIMVALAKLAEHRDNDTGLHLDRVTKYCSLLAAELRTDEALRVQIDEDFLYNLERAVPLHDIGKVAIPDQILLHPGRLTEPQMAVMRTHAAIGAKTIRSLIDRTPDVGFLEMAADIAHYHHERYDGAGYPLGLKRDGIPLAARIAAVADVYDALTTKRVYKDAFSHDRAVAVIVDGSGTQFDPLVVNAFVEREKEFAELACRMADDVEPQAVTCAESPPRVPS